MNTFEKCIEKEVQEGTTYETMILVWIMHQMAGNNRELLKEAKSGRWVLAGFSRDNRAMDVLDRNTNKLFRIEVTVG